VEILRSFIEEIASLLFKNGHKILSKSTMKLYDENHLENQE
jgi:hypothetical protein